MRALGLIIASIGAALTVLSFVLFELWQDDGAFYVGFAGGANMVALIVSTLGLVGVVIGLAMFYNNEHGEKIGW